MVKRTRGAKVKVIFQGLRMTHVIFSMLDYTQFNIVCKIQIHLEYKLILYHIYYALMPSIT
jgi:hypothetical protein